MGMAISVAPVFLQSFQIQVMNQGNETRFCRVAAHDFEDVPSTFLYAARPGFVWRLFGKDILIICHALTGMAGKNPRVPFSLMGFTGIPLLFLGFDTVMQVIVIL